MSITLRKLTLATATLAIIGVTAAEAAPISVTPAATIGFSNGVGGTGIETVQYRRRYGYRGGYGRRYYGGGYGYNPGGAAVAGAALGLLGAGIAGAAVSSSYGYPAYGYGGGYGYPAYGYGGGYGYPAYGYGRGYGYGY